MRNASPVPSQADSSESPGVLCDKRVAFVGKLGGLNRRESQQLIRREGGIPVELSDASLSDCVPDVVIIGADQMPWSHDELLSEPLRDAAAQKKLEVITETQLWERLGMMDENDHIRRLYTPAMLADLLAIPISRIRNWHRRGLIIPAREVHRLPYFSFQEIATARRLAELVTAGVSPTAIEKQLAQLARLVPEVERPLAQLSVIVEGRDLLLRQGDGLVQVDGQRRFDFEATESDSPSKEALSRSTSEDAQSVHSATLSLADYLEQMDQSNDPPQLMQRAAALEDEGYLEEALESYRAVLMMAGPRAEVNFLTAELLYRMGDVHAARERYYATIELDEDYVEARANLGCVLAETGQGDLAIAAFHGALDRHPDYPDVHYHLARTLDEMGREDDALVHWRRFATQAPDSPWVDEARQRLGLIS